MPWQGRRPCAGEEWGQSRRETPLPAAASLRQRQLCAPQGQGWPLRQARDPARANDGWRLKGGIPESPPRGRPPRACERERGRALAGVRRGPLAVGGGGGPCSLLGSARPSERKHRNEVARGAVHCLPAPPGPPHLPVVRVCSGRFPSTEGTWAWGGRPCRRQEGKLTRRREAAAGSQPGAWRTRGFAFYVFVHFLNFLL